MKPKDIVKFTPNNLSVPEGLFGRVMSRIETERKLVALRRRLIFAAVLLAGSVAAFAFMLRLFWLDISSSGFGQYLSLFFYDFRFIAADWQDYAFSLLETLPALSAGVFLATVLGVLYGLKLTWSFGREFLSSSRQLSTLNH